MCDRLIQRLESYRKKKKLTYDALSKKLNIPGNYIFRWKKAGRIIGIYKRVIEDFLDKESSNNE